MTFIIDNPVQQPPFGKYVWEKPSVQELNMFIPK